MLRRFQISPVPCLSLEWWRWLPATSAGVLLDSATLYLAEHGAPPVALYSLADEDDAVRVEFRWDARTDEARAASLPGLEAACRKVWDATARKGVGV